MGRRTPLYDLHVELGARMVDFGGWDMPVNYGSQIEEHHAVRRDAGIFDVSHMCVIDARGSRVREFFSKLIANDVAKLTTSGKALYSCMLNEAGGVIDDLIVYFIDESFFRVVVNAGTRDKDLAWMRGIAPSFGVELTERTDLGMLAVQGPNARAKVAELHARRTARGGAGARAIFRAPRFHREGGDWFVARTGYTGEDGFEIMLPAPAAESVWRALNAKGVKSAGLGARDTLRLEAAMNLYGNDMDESQNPLESGLAWTVSFDNPARDFIGRKALEVAHRRRPAEETRCAGPGGSRRVARSPESHRARSAGRERGRNHQRHVLADDGEIHRAGACAAREVRPGTGRRSRQASQCTRGQGALRSQGPGAGSTSFLLRSK